MRSVEQLRQDFGLYLDEIDRCEKAQCYWALLHVLIALPDVCGSLESNPTGPKVEVGDRYVSWCRDNLPNSATVSAEDRYQMRSALLHAGSSTPQNVGAKHHTSYKHFSYIDPDNYDITFHGTTNPTGSIVNVQIEAFAAETKLAVEKWFHALQGDPVRLSYVVANLPRLARRQPKVVKVTQGDGSTVEVLGWTRSSS